MFDSAVFRAGMPPLESEPRIGSTFECPHSPSSFEDDPSRLKFTPAVTVPLYTLFSLHCSALCVEIVLLPVIL